MRKNWLMLVMFIGLGYGFYLSGSFMTVATGVAIFLFGMLFMEKGFHAFTEGGLKVLLERSTKTVPRSLLFGFTTTAVVQSSSLVTVIAISSLSAGLIALKGGIAIIYGANIGTTTGAWLMATLGMSVKLSSFAMPMIVFGLIFLFQKKPALRGYGNILAGVGFVFLGIAYMKDGFAEASASVDLARYAMPGLRGLLVYTLLGIVSTVVMQSSHATLMLTIAALSTGQVNYDNALALAIGSNVGTTVTALLGSLSANIAGKRLAVAHVIFNVFTGVLALALIEQFKAAVETVSQWSHIAADNWTLKLAVFHSLFNVVGVVVMTPVLTPLVKLLERVFRDTRAQAERERTLQPLYLNDAALKLPDTAVEVLLQETQHLFERVFEVLAHGLNLHREDILNSHDLKEVVERSTRVMDIDVLRSYYRGIKALYGDIISFATRATTGEMAPDQIMRVHHIRLACRNVAEIIKLLAQIRPNINQYMTSENIAIREQYQAIREMLGSALRQLFSLPNVEDADEVRQRLAQVRQALDAQDVLMDGSLDQLVREGAITSEMATSLMNDSAFAMQMGDILIQTAEYMLTAAQPRKTKVA
ncbi:Na/Pi cotransporter family protein [Planctomycetota bacterium]